MTESEYQLRMLLYRTGKRLVGDVLDKADIVDLGIQLITESKICRYCEGTGEDGDPDGGLYGCPICNGKGMKP